VEPEIADPAPVGSPSPTTDPAPVGSPSPTTPAVVVVGEAVIDVVDTPDGPVGVPGGSPANTAVALARLGVRTYLRGRLSADGDGDRLRRHLAGGGVLLNDALTVPEPTTVIRATLDSAGQATYDASLTGCADLGWTSADVSRPLPVDTVLVLSGSLAAAEPPGAAAVEAWLTDLRASRPDLLLAYDPNIRPGLHAAPPTEVRARAERLIRLSHVLKASEEDLAWLCPGRDPLTSLNTWMNGPSGPLMAVLTRGAAGATAITRDGERIDVPGVPVQVRDTIGAGDTFMAALLSHVLAILAAERAADLAAHSPADLLGMWASDPPAVLAALTFASHAAALVCARTGCQPPEADEVTRAMAPLAPWHPAGPANPRP